jgi:tetratricopeptide (TPR) repeat protein
MSFYEQRSSAIAEDAHTQTSEAIQYFRQGRCAQALSLLFSPQKQDVPAAAFTLGLCHLSAGELPTAISCFEKVLRLLRLLPAFPPNPLEQRHLSETVGSTNR